MKKIIAILILLIIPSSDLFVQNISIDFQEYFNKFKQERIQYNEAIGIDSVITYNDYNHKKYNFIYNKDSNFYKIYVFTKWQQSDEWQNSLVYTFNYSPQGMLSSKSEERWVNNQWQKGRNWIYKYDSENRIISYIYEKGNEENNWIPQYQKKYKYENGLDVSIESYKMVNEDWIIDSREKKVYNSNDKLIEHIYEEMKEEKWENSFKYFYIYDEDLIQRSSSFEWYGNKWIMFIDCIYEYNDDDKLTSQVYSGELTSQYFYKYYPNGKLKSILYRDWDVIALQDIRLTTYYYNFEEKVDSVHILNYQTAMSPGFEEKIEYTYDEHMNLTGCISLINYGSDWIESGNVSVAGIKTSVRDKYGNIQVFNGHKIHYYWGTISSVEKRINVSSDLISPNPATNTIHLQTSTQEARIEIYSSIGSKVMSMEFKKQIDISSLPNGVYFLKFNNEFYKFNVYR